MKSLTIPLVDWGMGAILIGFFAVVCIGLVLIVLNMAKSDKSISEINNTTDNTSNKEEE